MLFDDKEAHLRRLLLVLDLCLHTLIYICSYWIYELFYSTHTVGLQMHLALLPIILIPQGFFMTYLGIYKSFRIESMFNFAWTIFTAMALTMGVVFALIFMLKLNYVSRLTVLTYALAAPITVIIIRVALVWWYFKRSVQKGENYLKVLIIGTGDRAERLATALKQNGDWGVDIIGHLDIDKNKVGQKVLNAPVLGVIDEIDEILEKHVVDEVILAIPRKMMGAVEDIAYACENEGVRFRLMADIYDLQLARMRLVQLDNIPLLSFEPVAQNEAKLLVKRLFDLTAILLAMPFILPVLAIVALAVKLDSPGAVMFIQQRVGLRKRVFPMYKFRTMVQNSEALLKDLESKNEADGPIFKMANDPRITRVGKFLRKTSLDELPQLFNVIRGHMSLVGPRPMSLRDVNLFDKGIQRKRFSVKPGLTCIWQISGRSSLTFDQWLELDLKYIDSWTIGLDIKILLKTIPTVLKGSGAV